LTVEAKPKAKSFAKPSPDSKTQLRAIINATPQLKGSEIKSLTANVNNGFDIPTAIENSVSKGINVEAHHETNTLPLRKWQR